MTSIQTAVDKLESSIINPSEGLPEEIFLFLTRITPMINVDLLIKNEQNYTLLTWRDDGYYPAGWHIPGGIIRFKETIEQRIHKVALSELGTDVIFKNIPIAINEVIHPSRKNRGHFISLLYECKLTGLPDKKLKYEKGIPKPGEWSWHKSCPDNIITTHEIYRFFLTV